jgi:hypothetical protein
MSANPLTELSSVIPDSDEAPMQEPTLGPGIRYTVPHWIWGMNSSLGTVR